VRIEHDQVVVHEVQWLSHHKALLLAHVQACGITGQSDPRIPRLRGCPAARASDVPYRLTGMSMVSKATFYPAHLHRRPSFAREKSEPLSRWQSGELPSGEHRRTWKLFLHGCGRKGIGRGEVGVHKTDAGWKEPWRHWTPRTISSHHRGDAGRLMGPVVKYKLTN
jgi:hypothetical protein